MLGGLNPEEDAIIDRAITETYALKDITAESNFADIEPPLLSDFEMVLGGMEGAETLAQRLNKYTKGTWAGFINKPTNVDINKNFVVFSVRDMEDDLKPVFIDYLKVWRKKRIPHIQFNVVDRETLIEAQQHPEDHPELIVRVAGFSAYFADLSKGLQDHIIARTEQSFS